MSDRLLPNETVRLAKVADPSGNPIDPFDLVGQRRTPGAFLARMHERLGHPAWLIDKTSFANYAKIPDSISVRDSLTIYGNLARNRPDDPYYIAYANAGVPLYYGALDAAMRAAPNLLDALGLLPRYADDRPGYHRHILTREGDRWNLTLDPTTDLGEGRGLIVETALLLHLQLASRIVGRQVGEARVSFTHRPPAYAQRLRAALQCEVQFGATRDAISFPEHICRIANLSHDSEVWRTTLRLCDEEAAARGHHQVASDIRKLIAQSIQEANHVPRVQEIADRCGISPRTLIRQLRNGGTTFQRMLDDVLQSKCRILLADTKLTIAQVAEELGLPDASGFHRRCRRWFGRTPTQVRRDLVDA